MRTPRTGDVVSTVPVGSQVPGGSQVPAPAPVIADRRADAIASVAGRVVQGAAFWQVAAILALPALREWTEAARAEPWVLA